MSVCILTFNQEKYIKEAIEGCLNQITNFNYEILIHDDASNDGTISILREYERDFPNKIKLILEKENQYSKVNHILPLFMPYIKGKYIAINEGDDYWCNPNKLQMQIDFLEKHKDYSLSIHRTLQINNSGKEMLYIGDDVDKDVSIDNIILGGGSAISTNSMVFHSKFLKSLPDYYHNCTVGDYPLSIYLAHIGKIHYFKEIMSVYRFSSEGSWTSEYANNPEFYINHNKEIIEMLKQINQEYKYIYTDLINKRIQELEVGILIYSGKLREIKKKYNEFYKKLTVKMKIKMLAIKLFPKLYKIIRNKLSRVNK